MNPPSPVPPQVTELLAAWRAGDRTALDQLLPLVEPELRRLARQRMRRERPGHTLQTTALVNETYLRLAGGSLQSLSDRTHFFAVAAQIMRRILVDHARAYNARKRGGDIRLVPLDEAAAVLDERAAELVALDDALDRLAQFDPRRAKVVEMRYFGGMTVDEIADVLQVHPNTVARDWTAARAWLFAALRGGGSGDA